MPVFDAIINIYYCPICEYELAAKFHGNFISLDCITKQCNFNNFIIYNNYKNGLFRFRDESLDIYNSFENCCKIIKKLKSFL